MQKPAVSIGCILSGSWHWKEVDVDSLACIWPCWDTIGPPCGLRCDKVRGLGPGPDATGAAPPGIIPAIIGPAWLTCGPPGTATPGCICCPIDTPGCIPWLEGWPCTIGWPPCATPAGPIMPGCPANGCAILAIMFEVEKAGRNFSLYRRD